METKMKRIPAPAVSVVERRNLRPRVSASSTSTTTAAPPPAVRKRARSPESSRAANIDTKRAMRRRAPPQSSGRRSHGDKLNACAAPREPLLHVPQTGNISTTTTSGFTNYRKRPISCRGSLKKPGVISPFLFRTKLREILDVVHLRSPTQANEEMEEAAVEKDDPSPEKEATHGIDTDARETPDLETLVEVILIDSDRGSPEVIVIDDQKSVCEEKEVGDAGPLFIGEEEPALPDMEEPDYGVSEGGNMDTGLDWGLENARRERSGVWDSVMGEGQNEGEGEDLTVEGSGAGGTGEGGAAELPQEVAEEEMQHATYLPEQPGNEITTRLDFAEIESTYKNLLSFSSLPPAQTRENEKDDQHEPASAAVETSHVQDPPPPENTEHETKPGDKEAHQPEVVEEEVYQPEVAEDKEAYQPEVVEGEEAYQPEAVEDDEAYQPEVVEDKEAYQPEVVEGEEAYQPEVVEDDETYQPEVAEDKEAYQPEAVEDEQPGVVEDEVAYQPEVVEDEQPGVVVEGMEAYQPEAVEDEQPGAVVEDMEAYQPEAVEDEQPRVVEDEEAYQPEVVEEAYQTTVEDDEDELRSDFGFGKQEITPDIPKIEENPRQNQHTRRVKSRTMTARGEFHRKEYIVGGYIVEELVRKVPPTEVTGGKTSV